MFKIVFAVILTFIFSVIGGGIGHDLMNTDSFCAVSAIATMGAFVMYEIRSLKKELTESKQNKQQKSDDESS